MVTEDKGLSVIMLKNANMLFVDSATDITDRVIDAL